jgi:nucleoside-diphosphate-sugar epimerase
MTGESGPDRPVLRIYITGATGFVGSFVVAAARARGHHVLAVVRPGGDPGPLGDGVTPRRVDLRSRAGLTESLEDADVVIHLAAAKAGDFATQFAGTVNATENLLNAMEAARVRRLVAVSTFSVYDYHNLRSRSLIDERTPIDRSPHRRDEYARTKLIQEELYRSFAASDGADGHPNLCSIIRPGMIYGPHNLWHALLGTEAGPAYLRIGSRSTLPMLYVENCAEALILAAENLAAPEPTIDGEIINLVDDDLPSQSSYARAVAARTEVPPTITAPWPLVRAGAETLSAINDRVLGGRAKFPGIAVSERLDARFKPFRYTNDRAKRLLSWEPRFGLVEAIDRSLQVEQSPPAGPLSLEVQAW